MQIIIVGSLFILPGFQESHQQVYRYPLSDDAGKFIDKVSPRAEERGWHYVIVVAGAEAQD